MLYEIGVIMILLSCVFCGGSALVPITMAAVGISLMYVGRRTQDGNNTDTER